MRKDGIRTLLTDSQWSVSKMKTAHLSHLSNSLASVIIFVTKHSKLLCSSNILLASARRIWFLLYSRMEDSKSWAFWMPMPQKVR